MSEIQSDDLPVPDELTSLKQRADMLGITYHPSIGLDKLRANGKTLIAIGYDSTATYVKRVLNYYEYYQKAYATDPN